MKKYIHAKENFNILSSFSEFAAQNGLSFSDSLSIAPFIELITENIHNNMMNQARLYGLRSEAMFAYMVAAMGKCKLLKHEDSGEFFCRPESIKRPDYRVVTNNNEQLLIEVKNFYHKNPVAPYKLSSSYMDSLMKYAEIMQCRLMLAVFWSRWKLWTLTDFADIPSNGCLTMEDAMKKNHMNLLGDYMIATEPPLSIRFNSDPAEPSILDSEGKCNFLIESVNLYSNGKKIERSLENKIAWFLILFGDWSDIKNSAEVNSDNVLDYFETSFNPIEPSNNQTFDILGFLSQMISRQYIEMTSEKSKIKCFVPNCEPDKLGILIPEDYEGEILKLWRFEVLSNSKADY